MIGSALDLSKFQQHVKEKSPAFVPAFRDKSRYQVLYGGAGSGKSHIVARKILYRLLQESDVKHNFLIIRKVDKTIKKSVWTLILNIIKKWGIYEDFTINQTDRTLIYNSTGSQIMFSGLDDQEKLKSIEGVTSIWCEEATELKRDDFDQLDLRLRGNHGCLKQIILTFNPVSEHHWVKKTFFDDPIDGVFTLKTTYLDNNFIDDQYKLVMENKRKTNPRFYSIYALGNWGTSEGLVFTNVTDRFIPYDEIEHLPIVQGLDFGFSNHPTAFTHSRIDTENKKFYVYDSFYEKGLTNDKIAEKIIDKRYHKTSTTCDSAEPKSIAEIKREGVKVAGAKKGRDSIRAGINFLQNYEIVVNSHNIEVIKEFETYEWSKNRKTDQLLNVPVDDYNHAIDSIRYSLEKYIGKSGGGIYDTFKKKR